MRAGGHGAGPAGMGMDAPGGRARGAAWPEGRDGNPTEGV